MDTLNYMKIEYKLVKVTARFYLRVQEQSISNGKQLCVFYSWLSICSMGILALQAIYIIQHNWLSLHRSS